MGDIPLETAFDMAVRLNRNLRSKSRQDQAKRTIFSAHNYAFTHVFAAWSQHCRRLDKWGSGQQ